MKVHPNLAGAIFIVFYFSLVLVISVAFKVKIYESKLFIVIGLIGMAIINRLFVNKYYDAILEEKNKKKNFAKR